MGENFSGRWGGKLFETACCSAAPTATKFLDRLAARNAGYNLTIRQVRWSLDGSGSAPGIRSWARAYGVGSLNGRRIGHELHLSRRSVTVLSQSHRSCMICGSETASTFIIMSMGAWISGGTKDFLISLTLHISRHIIRHIWMSAHTKKKR